jgi:hypothetical protein
MKELAILSISLLIFVFLAGCVNQQTSTGSGVVIKSLTAIPTTTEPDMPVLLQLDIQNTGGTVAGGVTAELLGLTDDWSISPVRTQSIGELYPSDSSRGITEGEERIIEWELSAPGKTRDMPYSATAHVSYAYTTTMEAEIKAIEAGYLRQTGESGGIEFQGISTGPLSIKIIAPTTVISGGRIPVQVQIQNTGGGYVTGNRLSLQTSGLNCSKYDVTLIGGKSASLYCTLPIGKFTNYKIFPVSISTTYTYWAEEEISITVLKTPVTE